MNAIGIFLILATCAAAPSAAAQVVGQERSGFVARTPAPVKDILHAQRFILATGYRNYASPKLETVTTGFVVVLEVEPALARRRDGPGPVLYAGDEPVDVLNFEHRSGRVIGIVAGDVDLSSTPFWYGAPDLPGGAGPPGAQRAQAGAEIARPFSRARLRAVTRPPVTVADAVALRRTAVADLVLLYSPTERELVDVWRTPAAEVPRSVRRDRR